MKTKRQILTEIFQERGLTTFLDPMKIDAIEEAMDKYASYKKIQHLKQMKNILLNQ